MRPSGCHDNERIFGHHVGPSGGQRRQVSVCLTEVDAVLTPAVPVKDEVDLMAEPRMERMRDPDRARQIPGARRS